MGAVASLMTHADLLDEFQKMRAVVLGDLILDRYVFGKATRISAEAPVMVIEELHRKRVPGGAGNTAINTAALGAKTCVVGVVGDDAAGRSLLKCFGQYEGIEAKVAIEKGRKTVRKTRVVADHAHQVMRIDREYSQPQGGEAEGESAGHLRQAASGASALVISDYDKGTVTPGLIRQALESGIKVVVNCKPANARKYAGADLLSLNRAEFAAVSGRSLSSPQDGEREIRAFREELGVGALLVTFGPQGMAYATETDFQQVPAPRVEVADPAGAGDTTIATCALGLAVAGPVRPVFELAAAVAAKVVAHVGVAAPSAEDLAAVRVS